MSIDIGKRRAEEFARLVDGSSSASPGRHADLLELVGTLRAVAPVEARPAYVADLRERLMAEARTTLVPVDRRLLLRQRPQPKGRHRLASAAVAVVLLGAPAGLAAASTGAAPGEPLYSLKRGLERIAETVSFGDAARGSELLDQATERLAEARSLTDSRTSPELVDRSLDDFVVSASDGGALLLGAYRDDRDPESVVAVRTFTADSMARLDELARVAPAGSDRALAQAAQTLLSLDEDARDACPGCAPEEPLALPAALDRLVLTSATPALGDLLSPSSDLQRALQASAGTGTVSGADPGKGAGALARRTTAAAAEASSGTLERLLPRTRTTATSDLGRVVTSTVDPVTSATGTDKIVGGTVDGLTGTVDDTVGGLTDTLGDATDGLLP